MQPSKQAWGLIKLAVFIVCLTPFLLLCLDTWQDNLGANPIEALHIRLGDWALRFLCLNLFLSPYKHLTGQHWVNRFRRMLGLYCFFYAFMHLLVYIVLDLSLSSQALLDEIRESPYILFGLITFVLLLPMAMTSSKNMQRRLGKNWKRLHSLIYPAAITAVLHYILLVKSDLNEPLIYADIVLILLAYRLIRHIKKQRIMVKTS
ncbi:protein-methionine-sulfoxide reductase heme-binding subunit MsrQ [Methylomarinum sp. Ch1-1]|uniref:Protein-methionine-sulfoxide reductase heme-binding subunit MsrQ n=1 Tax=Methylomarinum roseum TaxID=3067653 RepID=A0AAU7NV39_9GAMM|nr:protein-methionine-sulfoxide reductase heme-binding subunit MsrQ [Methylomarinum sp. Ch1-1]MDP4523061.1 protein-methionine-sulfoxide reductase heme-binding subunit MsrQ [Methylomarinum sp. Ch1-1]